MIGNPRSSQTTSEDIIQDLKFQLRAQEDELSRIRNETIERVYSYISHFIRFFFQIP